MNCAGHVARMGDRRGACWGLVEKREWKRPLGKPRRRWETNTKMNPQEVNGKRGLGCSGSGLGQVVGCCECGYEPSGCLKCGEFRDSS